MSAHLTPEDRDALAVGYERLTVSRLGSSAWREADRDLLAIRALVAEVERLRERMRATDRLAALGADLDLLADVAASGIPADVLRPVLRAHMRGATAPAPVWDEDAVVEAATCAVQHSREFAAGAAFGIPLDARESAATAIASAVLAVVREHLPALPVTVLHRGGAS